MTAAEKMMCLDFHALCGLIRAHMRLRQSMKPHTIDATALRELSEFLGGMAWDIERKRA